MHEMSHSKPWNDGFAAGQHDAAWDLIDHKLYNAADIPGASDFVIGYQLGVDKAIKYIETGEYD